MNRERIQEIIARIEMFGHGAGYTVDEVYELARIALAAMDSEPVAWTSEEAIAEVYCDETGMIGPKHMVGDVPHYRHVQPTPVVLKDHQIRELVNQLRDVAIEYNGTQQLRERIARVIRAAMLNQK